MKIQPITTRYKLLTIMLIIFQMPTLSQDAIVFLEINIFVGKMGEINKWPQAMAYPEVKKAFHLPCEILKMARQKP